MFAKLCASCGGSFEAKRDAARFCSARCRQRNRRSSSPATPADAPEVPVLPLSRTSLFDATLAELRKADRHETALGQNALMLAGHLDNGFRETGAAIAALERSFRAALADALRGAEDDADELDGLRDRAFRVIAGGRI